jgi:hypothetical protein
MMPLKFKYAMKKSIHIKFLNYSYVNIVMVNFILIKFANLECLNQVENMKY